MIAIFINNTKGILSVICRFIFMVVTIAVTINFGKGLKGKGEIIINIIFLKYFIVFDKRKRVKSLSQYGTSASIMNYK